MVERDRLASLEVRDESVMGKILYPIVGAVKKIQGSYFFGFFESLDETDSSKAKGSALQTPWFLKPYLTFPIAFAVVGAAFAFVVANGGVYQRGVETEFLDENSSSGGNIEIMRPSLKQSETLEDSAGSADKVSDQGLNQDPRDSAWFE